MKFYAIYISYVSPRDFSLTTFYLAFRADAIFLSFVSLNSLIISVQTDWSFMRYNVYINNNTIHGCQKAVVAISSFIITVNNFV